MIVRRDVRWLVLVVLFLSKVVFFWDVVQAINNNDENNDKKNDKKKKHDVDKKKVCQSQQQHNSISWFLEDDTVENETSSDAATKSLKDGLQFLQDNVFGQKQPKPKRGSPNLERGMSFSHLLAQPTTSDDDKKDDKGGHPTTLPSVDEQQQRQNSGMFFKSLTDIMSADDPAKALLTFILDSYPNNKNGDDTTQSVADTAHKFLDHAQQVMEQVQRVVGDKVDALMDECFFWPSAWYLLRHEQMRKHPYWKTRKHKYMVKTTDVGLFRELHQALYLSDLAYVDDDQQVREGLARLDNGNWELIYVDTKGNPSEPAHFMAVEKQAEPLPRGTAAAASANRNHAFWQKAKRFLFPGNARFPASVSDTLKVMIVIRGTKTIADILTDGHLEAKPYKGEYKVHGGIQKSGSYIVQKHVGRLQQLLQISGRSKIQLLLFGHSLGCGSAAIAAMEFHDHYKDFLDVKGVGFGCPSLVSAQLGEQYKDIFLTVVADADVVVRMSGASIVNLHLDMMALDWTGHMMEELAEWGDDMLNKIVQGTGGIGYQVVQDLFDKMGQGVEAFLTTTVQPKIHKCVNETIPKLIGNKDGMRPMYPKSHSSNNSSNSSSSSHGTGYRMEHELIPPGTCLHLYRTATGFEAAYTPCTFFDEIEYVPHMVDDHLTQTGYHVALLSMLRQQSQDYNAAFENELVSAKKP